MSKKHLIDIDCLSNGQGKTVYGGRLDAYSLYEISCQEWFDLFCENVYSALGKSYFPVYRIADGELRFLFGYRINWKNNFIRSLLRFIKYEILVRQWKTSWGESYDTKKISQLRSTLKNCIKEISNKGKLAIYWNENGLDAFTEYNKEMENLFSSIGVEINENNYIPFHFGQALIANYSQKFLFKRNVLIVSGIKKDESINLCREILNLGANNIEIYNCSQTTALDDDYSNFIPNIKPDIALVAAGIGSAKILVELKHLNIPIIDIGSYIHVISGKIPKAHAGFFVKPTVNF